MAIGFKQQIWISAAHNPGSENVIADKSFKIFERSSQWKLTKEVFKQIARTFGKRNIDLFTSRTNRLSQNYIFWSPAFWCSFLLSGQKPIITIPIWNNPKGPTENLGKQNTEPFWTIDNWILVLFENANNNTYQK